MNFQKFSGQFSKNIWFKQFTNSLLPFNVKPYRLSLKVSSHVSKKGVNLWAKFRKNVNENVEISLTIKLINKNH